MAGTEISGQYSRSLEGQSVFVVETPEEIAAFRIWGADMVGMSTAIEAIAARHAGMEVAAVSLISNPAAGIGKHELNHEEVKAAAAVGAQRFNALIAELVRRI